MIIRDQKQAHSEAIHELVLAAFQRPDEAVLIDRLRTDGASVISLVAVEGDEIVGQVLFSRVTAPFRALGLGPVSVKPSRQRAGIGSLLIRTGLDQAREAGWQGVFVLGDPKFYSRFGFDPDLAGGFKCRYSGPHLMAFALGRDLPTREGVIEYASGFDSVGQWISAWIYEVRRWDELPIGQLHPSAVRVADIVGLVRSGKLLDSTAPSSRDTA